MGPHEQSAVRTNFYEPLKPSLALEIIDHANNDNNHHAPHHEIPPRPLEFWHVYKIHTIDASDKSQRDEDCGDDSQDFHHFVHAIADAGKINVQHTRDHIPEGFNGVDHLDGVIIDITQVDQRFGLEQGGFASFQAANCFP